MPAVNLAPYDAQMAELERRQRIAQALAAAGAEQQDVPAYKGISAMPSRAGMLANVLKSFVGARQDRNIGRERTILGKQDTAAGQEFAQQMLRGMIPQQPPQAAPAPAAPPQAAPSYSPQDASGLPWGAVAQGEAPTGWFDGQQAAPAAGAYNPASGAGLTGVATNPASLAAAMGGAPAAPPQAPQAPPAAPQTAKTPGGNSPPPTYSPEQLQATIAAGLASPYPSVRAQAQAMMPMVNQHLQRSQQLADRAQDRTEQLADNQTTFQNRLREIQATQAARGVRSQMVDPGGDEAPFLVNLDTGEIMKTFTSPNQRAPRAMTPAEKASFGLPAKTPAYIDGNGNPHVLNIQQPRAATGYGQYAPQPVYGDDDVVPDPYGGAR